MKASRIGLPAFAAWSPLALTAFLATSVHAQSVRVPANREWMESGIVVTAGQRLVIDARGTWSIKRAKSAWLSPAGERELRSTHALVPFAPLGGLVGRLGDRVFYIGEHHAESVQAGGTLLLSINDEKGNFGDNTGAVIADISVTQPLGALVGNRVRNREYVVASAEDLVRLIKNVVLGGTRLQLTQTDNGTSVQIGGLERRSYIQFGPGLGDRTVALELHEMTFSPDQLVNANTGGTSLLAQYFVTHGFVFVDNIRFRVNNVHANLDEDASVRFVDGGLEISVKLHSSDPPILGEGNGYTSALGIPLPLGWQDGLCPDIRLGDLAAVLAISISVDESTQQVVVSEPTVRLTANVELSQFDFLLDNDTKTGFQNEVERQLQKQLLQPQTRAVIDAAVKIMVLGGRPNSGVLSVRIDSQGIETVLAKD